MLPSALTPSALALVLALVWDLALGEPPARFHPVVWMGRAIGALARMAPRGRPRLGMVYGAVLALAVPAAVAAAGTALLEALEELPAVRLLVEAFLLKSCFALRALGAAAFDVRDALARDDLANARRSLASLVSRDASALDRDEVVGAAIESVAENASDSFVAPLLAYLALGLPGALFYRAVNTLDAMIGYHGRWEHVGKAAARLDDVLNLLPARLTAMLLLAAGWWTGRDAQRAAVILTRDGARTESPNAGRPMAAMAGLLGVELKKRGHYALGDADEPLVPTKIDEAWRLASLAAFAMAAFSVAWAGLQHAVVH